MTFTPEQLRPYLPTLASPRWWVAFSGGLDSTVLLHALHHLSLNVELRAVHINHQLSPQADRWQLHCEQVCATLGVGLVSEKVQVRSAGKGIEDAARKARYEVFERYIAQDELLLTAHHADDQAETLLLRLMRGTGPRGLAAMARTRRLGSGSLSRPLLNFARTQLLDYAEAQNLRWIEDDSNSDLNFDRNFLRADVMPLLRNRWPGFTSRWQSTAELCADTELLLEEFAQQDLASLEPAEARLGRSISLARLSKLSPQRQRNVVRYWLRAADLSTPEANHWEQITQQLFSSRAESESHITWGNVSLRRYRDRLFLFPAAVSRRLSTDAVDPRAAEIPCLGGLDVALSSSRHRPVLWGNLYWELRESVNDDDHLSIAIDAVVIRYRSGGERCQPVRRAHSQTLKRLLQEYDLEPWLRDLVPLIYVGDSLVAVGDLWVCKGYAAPKGGAGYKISWVLADQG